MQSDKLANKKSLKTKDENLATEPESLLSLPDIASVVASSIPVESIQSDPETQKSKTKSRTRISSAFHKLTKSGRRKDRSSSKEPESLLSSGAEDNYLSLEEKPNKKKHKLSKSFLLGGLKGKSKVSPKNQQQELSQENLEDSLKGKEFSVLQTEIHSNLDNVNLNIEATKPSERMSKVQITITGKKVTSAAAATTDKQTVKEDKTLQGKDSKSIEEDKKGKKLKKSKTAVSGSISSSSSTPKTSVEEQFKATESKTDAPPAEKAPQKPKLAAVANSGSVITSSSSSSAGSSGAIRKPSTRAAATLTSPSLTAASKRTTSVATADIENKLMQRGHRLPKPPQAKQQESKSASKETPLVPITESTKTKPQEVGVKLQKQSHASTATAASTQPGKEAAAASALKPPAYPPPPIPSGISPSLTPETQSPIKTIQLKDSKDTANAALVASQTLEQQDDKISLAESAKTENTRTTPTQLEEHLQQSPQFALGGIVTPQPTSYPPVDKHPSLNQAEAEDILNDEQEEKTDTQLTDLYRKRIAYVPQPSLYEEYGIERKREALRTSGFTALALEDSDEEETSLEPYSMPAFGDLTMDQEMEPVRKAVKRI